MAKSKKITMEAVAKRDVATVLKNAYKDTNIKVLDNTDLGLDNFTADTLFVISENGVEVQVKLITPRQVDGKPGTYNLEN